MPNADAETERLIAWCEAQIPLQQEKMRGAQQVVTIYATPTTQGAVIGSDSEEAQFRSECANHFWQLADLLRRQAAALAARTREVEAMREDLDAVRHVEEWHKGGRRILHCEDGHWTALELVADRESPVGASLGGYYRRHIYASGDSYAALGRALAAQEGTR